MAYFPIYMFFDPLFKQTRQTQDKKSMEAFFDKSVRLLFEA